MRDGLYHDGFGPSDKKAGERAGVAVRPLLDLHRPAMPGVCGIPGLQNCRIYIAEFESPMPRNGAMRKDMMPVISVLSFLHHFCQKDV